MLEAPQRNKMMGTPPAKKGFHFASDGLHEALYIEAATIEEATDLYHKTKRLIVPAGDTQSTTSAKEAEEKAL